MRRWVAIAAGLVLVAILLSGDTPWRYTLFGLVSPPDFAQDLAAARVFASNQNPYEVGIARAHAELMKVSEDKGYLHFPHPPLLFLVLAADGGIHTGTGSGNLVWRIAGAVVPAGGPAREGVFRLRTLEVRH